MTNAWRHFLYLLVLIGVLIPLLVGGTWALLRGQTVVKPQGSRANTLHGRLYANLPLVIPMLPQGQAGIDRATVLRQRQLLFQTASATPQPTATAAATATPNVETPVPSTPTLATPTLSPPTATPTATPTLVPTREITYPLYVPVLLNQREPTLRNGDFEAGNRYWTEYSRRQYRLILARAELQTVVPHGGEWAAWLGGKNNETSELSQRVTVPSETPVLHFWYSILAEPDCGLDIASILVDDQLIDQFQLCQILDVDWTERLLDLQRFRGQIVTIQFRVDTDRNGRHSNLFLDDVEWRVTSEP
ncbi:MAG: hypothetical protein KDE53_00915 [Caldilineaceae bacterium]|nr:hypothetical protein [Caldilineaceae bacterium]MCB0125171.1 hypothetical protein [Caldilineaceae bacterium]